MKTKVELDRATVPTDCRPDLLAVRDGGLVIVSPHNHRAARWIENIASCEATWLGESLVIELSSFVNLADLAIDAGFRFEREPYPN